MAAITKFMFDTTFDAEAGPARAGGGPSAPSRVLLTKDEFEAAKATAFADGERSGHAKAASATESRLAAASQTLAAQTAALLQRAESDHQSRQRDAVAVAVSALRRLMPALAGREAANEISTLFRDCVARLHDEPRIVVRVNDSLLDTLRERLDGIAAGAGFAGRLVLLADPALSPGDARIEWADGGVERTPGAVQAEISAAVDRYLAKQ